MRNREINQHKFAVFVTLRQLWIIREFVDICSRLLIGQIENPLWNLFISKDLDYEEFHEKAFALKQVIFPELDRNSSYSVGWKEGDSRQNKSQVAYEIEAMIAHELWKREPDRSDGGVRAHEPLHYSDEALIRVEEINGEETKDEKIARLEREVARRDEVLRSTLSICFNQGNVFSPAAAHNEYWIVATTLGEIKEPFSSPVEACEAYLKLEEKRSTVRADSQFRLND